MPFLGGHCHLLSTLLSGGIIARVILGEVAEEQQPPHWGYIRWELMESWLVEATRYLIYLGPYSHASPCIGPSGISCGPENRPASGQQWRQALSDRRSDWQL